MLKQGHYLNFYIVQEDTCTCVRLINLQIGSILPLKATDSHTNDAKKNMFIHLAGSKEHI